MHQGSGLGAKGTKLSESLTAIICAIRFQYDKDLSLEDFYNLKFNLTEISKNFEINLDLQETIEFSQKEVGWLESSIFVANKIYGYLGQGNFKFLRCDFINHLMQKCFNNCNSKNNEFGKIEKWCPADIWIHDASIDISFLTKYSSFKDLNEQLIQLFRNKKLIGVSLKKVDHNAKIKEYNNQESFQQKISSIKYSKYILRMNSLDFYLCYEDNKGSNIRIQGRDFAGANPDKIKKDIEMGKSPRVGDFKFEIKGELANHGKIQDTVFNRILSNNGHEMIIWPKWKECDPLSESSSKITNEIFELLFKYKAQGFSYTTEYKKIIANQTNQYRFSKLCSLRALDFIEKKGRGEIDTILQIIHNYASSQSELSAPFLKVSNLLI